MFTAEETKRAIERVNNKREWEFVDQLKRKRVLKQNISQEGLSIRQQPAPNFFKLLIQSKGFRKV